MIKNVHGNTLDLLGEAIVGGRYPVGQSIRVQGAVLTVLGVLAPKGQTTSGKDQDDTQEYEPEPLVPKRRSRVTFCVRCRVVRTHSTL